MIIDCEMIYVMFEGTETIAGNSTLYTNNFALCLHSLYSQTTNSSTKTNKTASLIIKSVC